MLISEKHNFLFVHIAKNAGTSIRRALRPYALPTQKKYPLKLLTKLHLDFDWHWHHFRYHTSMAEAERQIPENVFDDLYKFAVVRNPWSRLVSSYHFKQQRKGHESTKRKVKKMGFSEFLRFAHKTHLKTPLAYSQKRRILLINGEIGTDMILRFEQLNQDWEELSGKIGLTADLPTANKSKHLDFREFYSDDDAEFVAQHWQDDIEAFGYRFDGAG